MKPALFYLPNFFVSKQQGCHQNSKNGIISLDIDGISEGEIEELTIDNRSC